MPKYAIEVEKTIMKKFVSSIITITLLLSYQPFSFAEENENNEYIFRANRVGKETTGELKLPLTRENRKLVLTMAGDIVKVIKANKKSVLRKTVMTDRVITYLEQYVEKTRNGYMHKDNLYEWSDIANIRLKTYAAYFMVLGTFFINLEKIMVVDK